ncbi:MAG: hypothetical protein VB087_04600 [Candidatus Limiplasma sp.]|nr:hypothetical protein [Candidatus Limiplasma sp.]MEA5145891.1 hypothetical protein [Candidatus Limiplasma sp.]
MAKARPWTLRMQQLFTPAEQARIAPYLNDVRARIDLRQQRFVDGLMLDHVDALRWYADHGLTLEAAMKRLDPAQLSDFYLRERTAWYPLDTAAKVYPLSMGLKRMMMFRMSFYLKNPVEPEILQMALTYTIKRFPYFATTIKCGFFWHYIDSAMRRYAARPETKPPCAPIRLNSISSPTFRVVWFQNRVSVEFFHVLTDGTGASIFLKTLLREYLRLLGHELPLGGGMLRLADAPDSREWADDFLLADKHPSPEGFGDKPALQMRGLPTLEQPSRVLHFNLSVVALRGAAKAAGVTITVFLLGLMMLALKEAAEPHGGKRKLQVQLPVNMRKFYPSKTLRNFSMYCSIRLHPVEITSLEAILPKLAAQVGEGTAKASLDKTMTLSRKLVRYLRVVPLIVKRPIAYLIYGKLSDGVFTTTFSNLGAISLPEEMAPYVDKFDFVLGPPIRNRAICSLCSYGDKAVFTVVKNTALPVFENVLYAQMVKHGLQPYVEGSL